jgi:hypothetical protein
MLNRNYIDGQCRCFFSETKKVFLIIFFLLTTALVSKSHSQCVGDVVLPVPDVNIPIFDLIDFTPEALDVFNNNITPITIPVVGGLLAPIDGIIGGFDPTGDFEPADQTLGYLAGLEELLQGVEICDLEALREIKPTREDLTEHRESSEVQDRIQHAQEWFEKNKEDPNFAENAISAGIPNKGGAPVGSVIADYIKIQVDLALDLLFPKQLAEPVLLVFPDPDILCMPKFEIDGACIPSGVCLPIGVSYNHVESTYNVHRPGHQALIPDLLVTPMMEMIKDLERSTDLWLPFAAVIMDKMDVHGYWGSRNPKVEVNSMASSIFLATQDPHTKIALELAAQAQDISGLLIPFTHDNFSVSALPSVIRTGSLPGFGTLPVGGGAPVMGSLILTGFPIHPLVRTQYHEYIRGKVVSDDINLKKYLAVRSMVPTITSEDSKDYREVLENFYTLHGNFLNVAQAEQFKTDSIYEYHRLPQNYGGGIMKDEIAPNGEKKQSWTNPLGPNSCVTIRGRTQYPEPTFANSTARYMCEVNQQIRVEQRECPGGEAKCPDARDDYWPNKASPTDYGCSTEYSLFPDPGTKCIYDKYHLHNTHAKGYYNGSVLPENLYPLDENDLIEKESPYISHLHRQRDCIDQDVAKTIFGGTFCGWIRCPDLHRFEPASNCVATSRYRPDWEVPAEGCL